MAGFSDADGFIKYLCPIAYGHPSVALNTDALLPISALPALLLPMCTLMPMLMPLPDADAVP
jgi:hypothetical protein